MHQALPTPTRASTWAKDKAFEARLPNRSGRVMSKNLVHELLAAQLFSQARGLTFQGVGQS